MGGPVNCVNVDGRGLIKLLDRAKNRLVGRIVEDGGFCRGETRHVQTPGISGEARGVEGRVVKEGCSRQMLADHTYMKIRLYVVKKNMDSTMDGKSTTRGRLRAIPASSSDKKLR